MPAPDDARWMRRALAAARRAGTHDEVPIGAVVVLAGELLAVGSNRPVTTSDPTAHAEIVALRRAARRLGNYRLSGADLYVTLEPCMMCLGAMIHARVRRLVYGAQDPKVQTVSGERPLDREMGLNHHLEVEGGLLADEAAALLTGFFADRRRGAPHRRKIPGS